MIDIYEILSRFEEINKNADSSITTLLIISLFTVILIILTNNYLKYRTDLPVFFILLGTFLVTFVIIYGSVTFIAGKERREVANELLPTLLSDKVETAQQANFNDFETQPCYFQTKPECVTVKFIDKHNETHEFYMPKNEYYKLDETKQYYIEYPKLSAVDLSFIKEYGFSSFYLSHIKVEEK